MTILKVVGAALAASLLGLGAGAASATTVSQTTFTFGNIAGGDTVGDSLAENFSLTVTEVNSTQVAFQLSSAANLDDNYFIGQVFFDFDVYPTTLLSPTDGSTSVYSTGTVNYVISSGNLNLPQGENLNPDFTADVGYDPDNPNHQGQDNVFAVNPGETVGFLFDGDYSDVIAALNDGSLRVGFHLQGIGTGPVDESDTYVNNPSPIPVPASGLLLLGALGALGFVRRRKSA